MSSRAPSHGKHRFSAAYIPPPSGASLSLHALARIVSFFPNGVPLAFVASNPMARVAGETYRAEENFRWTSDGLVVRERGERETFETYEARKVRRAGVQIGRLITVYHDALGHLQREIRNVDEHVHSSINPALTLATSTQNALRSGAHLERQSVLAEERCTKSIFTTPGKESMEFSPLFGFGGPAEDALHMESPSGGILLEQPDIFNIISFDSRRKDGDPQKVYYLSGPNRRSVYLWMDETIESEDDEKAEKEREVDNKSDLCAEKASLAANTSGPHIIPNPPSIHQRDLSKCKKSTKVTMLVVLEATRWWIQRPCVSTLNYLQETAYVNDTPLLPPPPPSLYVHFYGSCAEGVPMVLDALLPPVHTLPLPTSEDLMREYDVANRYKANGTVVDVLTFEDERDERSTRSNVKEQEKETEGVPIVEAAPPGSLNTEAVSEGQLKNNQLSTILTSNRSRKPSWEEKLEAKTVAVEESANQPRNHGSHPALEGIFIIGHPLMALRLTATTVISLAHSHLGRLKVLKLNGVYADDTGIQALLQLHSKQGRVLIRENTRVPIKPSPPPKKNMCASIKDNVQMGQLSHDVTSILTHSTTSLLEVADFGFCLAMTIFPLLAAPRDLMEACSANSLVITPLRRLCSLNMHGTSIDNNVLGVIAASCPVLDTLLLGSCQYVQDLHPLRAMKHLRILDAHGSRVDDVGIQGFCTRDFVALEELSLSGCTCLSEVTPLSRLAALRKLDLRHIPIRHGLAALQECTRLRQLAIASDATAVEQMRHRQPELYKLDYLSCLHTLTVLHLENIPRLSSTALELLAFSHSPLVSLILSSVPQLTSLSPLAGIPTLCELSVEDAESLGNEGLNGLRALHKLERVILRRCRQLSDFNEFYASSSLRYLDVRLNDRANISNESFKQFSMSSKKYPLEVLLISQYDGVSSLEAFRGLPLRVLDVRRCGLDDEGLEGVVDGRHVVSLYLSYNTKLTIANFLARLPQLRTLDLSGTRITDRGVWELCHAPRLETLLLVNCPGLKFLPFLHVFSALRVLSLSDNRQLTTARLKTFFYLSDESEEKFINPLFPTFSQLRELDISRTSVDAIAPLVNLRFLENLRLRGSLITPEGLKNLAEIRSLKLLDLRDVKTLEGELRPLFTQHRLERLDLRGALLNNDKVELPLPILADSHLRELVLDHQQNHLELMKPLLLAPSALKHLQFLLIDGADDADAEVHTLMARLCGDRPLLSVHYV